jgi:hypothetical protein
MTTPPLGSSLITRDSSLSGRGLTPMAPEVRVSIAPRFLWECLTSQIVSPFSAPATSNPACGFPALGFPACFVSKFV